MEEVWSTVHNSGPINDCRLKTIETEMITAPDYHKAVFVSLLTEVTLRLPIFT